MFFYVYQITNLINGKIYVGKHKSTKHPNENGYYGSGKQINAAIKKYGISNFKKEVLCYCDSLEEMAAKEAEIVTEDFVKRKDTYNMHKGGLGGFEHINLDPKKRLEVSNQSSKRNKELGLGGTQHWTDETWKKVRETSWIELIRQGVFDPNTWASMSDDEKEKRRKNISNKVSGSNNGSYGTKIYIDENHNGDLPPANILNKQRFKPGEQPKGWIPVTEWKDRKKNKKANAYGRHWYNDGQKNYYLYPTDAKIIELRLEKRRLINKNIIV
jgi:hypothetical protein